MDHPQPNIEVEEQVVATVAVVEAVVTITLPAPVARGRECDILRGDERASPDVDAVVRVDDLNIAHPAVHRLGDIDGVVALLVKVPGDVVGGDSMRSPSIPISSWVATTGRMSGDHSSARSTGSARSSRTLVPSTASIRLWKFVPRSPVLSSPPWSRSA